MTGWSELDRLLQTDPRDVGCDEAIRMLHIYVDLVLGIPGDDSTGEAATRYPGVAAHLAACGPCGETTAAFSLPLPDRNGHDPPDDEHHD